MKKAFGFLAVMLMLMSVSAEETCEGSLDLGCELRNFLAGFTSTFNEGLNNFIGDFITAFNDGLLDFVNMIFDSELGQGFLSLSSGIWRIVLALLAILAILPALVFMAVFLVELLFIVSSFSQRGSALHQFGVFMYYNYKMVLLPVSVVSSTLGWAVNKL